MPRFVKNNGLTIVLMLLFLTSLLGQWLTGWHVENEELARHGEAGITLGRFATYSLFLSTLFENWESEFLQMSAYVLLTCHLFQRGSAESKDPDEPARDSDLEQQAEKPGAPAILRAGVMARWLYANSLGIFLTLLFLLSFLLHWIFSARDAADAAVRHGDVPVTPGTYFWDAQFWFESFQNWQSEFLSTAVLVVLSIFLRQVNLQNRRALRLRIARRAPDLRAG